MISFKKQKEKKRKEEDQRRLKVMAEMKLKLERNLETLRNIKLRTPREYRNPIDGHEFQYNTEIYHIQRSYIENKTREAGISLEGIGISNEELNKIYRAAVRADIIVDAPELGLIVEDPSLKVQ